jgi:hypothetical protein
MRETSIARVDHASREHAFSDARTRRQRMYASIWLVENDLGRPVDDLRLGVLHRGPPVNYVPSNLTLDLRDI